MTADFIAKVFAAATLLAVVPQIIHAQDLRCERGDVEVRGLNFVGNRTFPSADLANVIVTTPSAWARRVLDLPFSAKRCLDRTEYANDRLRLMVFYRRRGFPDVTVDTVLIPSGLGGVRAQFTITEGAPIILHSFVIAGLDSVLKAPTLLRNLPIRAGNRFDRTKIEAAMDSVTRRLRNRGYPAVVATNWYGIHSGSAGPVAEDSILVHAGPLTRIGAVRVRVIPVPNHTQQIANPTVQRILKIDSGQIYREQRISDAQRSLYQTNGYAHVDVTLDSTSGVRMGSDSVVPLLVSLVENPIHTVRVGAGYGTLDCLRGSGELDDYNFLGGARQLTLQGRVSKIGRTSQLCPQAQQDPYSKQLNYYLGATLAQPFLFGLRAVPSVTAYRSRVSEYNAYVRTTNIGGVASLLWQRSFRTPITVSYSMDYGRTEAQPALFCAVFNLCDSEDRSRVQQNLRLAVVSVVISHDGSNSTVSPSAGGTSRFEVRYASPRVFSDTALQFKTLLGDIARYISLGGGNVLALHLNGGAVFGRNFGNDLGFVPPQERLYAGGPNSVRGFAQNELGAVTYIAQTYQVVHQAVVPRSIDSVTYFRDTTGTYQRIVPVGGKTLVVGNVELRLRSPILPDVLQFALFADAGNVWNRGAGASVRDAQVKVTPGIQVAALTPVGPVRLSVGYNPYRLPAGPLYYESTSFVNGALPCVSPGSTSVTRASDSTLVQASGQCTATFHPAENKSFRSRLTLGLAIGQAF